MIRSRSSGLRLRGWLILFVAAVAFALGSFTTVSVQRFVNSFGSDTSPVQVAEPAQSQVDAPSVVATLAAPSDTEVAPQIAPEDVVTRIAPQPILTVEDAPTTPVASLATRPAQPLLRPQSRATIAPPTTAADITSGYEAQILTLAAAIEDYDMIAVEEGGVLRAALHFRDAEPTAQILRSKIKMAAQDGLVDASHALIADGAGLDAQTYLFELVQARLASGGQDEARAARTLRQKAFAASTARTQTIDGQQIYVVQPGDSLAYISLQFYGNTTSASQIIAANSDLLSKPAELKAGMQLVIPNA